MTKRLAVADMSPMERKAWEGINTALHLAHTTETEAGWYLDPETGKPIERNFGEVVMLMVTELAEAIEADRKGLNDDKLPHRLGQEVEFADCLIRMLGTAAARGYDIAGAFIEKNRVNGSREDHRIENRTKAGGKRY